MTSLTIHNQKYEYLSWEDLGQDIFNLAKQIIESGAEFDRVVALAKGGLAFSRSMTDFLGIKKLSTIQIEFYSGINEAAPTPVITQSLPVSIKGERVLIFDDIVDSGETINLAVRYMKQHGASAVATAALLNKPWAKHQADFKARSSEAWVIFPNEIRETINLLSQMWQEKGDSADKITQQLLEIGFSKAEVELFANLK